MPYFQYNNHKCYYRTIGSGTPLLFLHGNTASSKMFECLLCLYSYDYQVILLDFLGHGLSERVEELSTDLWFDEAMQVIAFLEQTKLNKVHIIGSSGGALVAINVALERPELVGKVIADSFEGEIPLKAFVSNIYKERQASKSCDQTIDFYRFNQGDDWEQVVDNDTRAMYEHYKTIGRFFHKPLESLQAPILLTGSCADEYVTPEFYKKTYSSLLKKIPDGKMHLFEQGSHPAILSNARPYSKIAIRFIEGNDNDITINHIFTFRDFLKR